MSEVIKGPVPADHYDYELFGYIKDNEFVQKYKAWGAKSAKQWADYCNSEDFPQALSRLLNTIVEKE